MQIPNTICSYWFLKQNSHLFVLAFIYKPQSENLEKQLMWDVVQYKTLGLYFLVSAQISLLFYIPI